MDDKTERMAPAQEEATKEQTVSEEADAAKSGLDKRAIVIAAETVAVFDVRGKHESVLYR